MFKNIYNQTIQTSILDKINSASKEKVEQILLKDSISWEDFLLLLSESAEGYLEQMAKKAHEITLRRFGKTIQLYAPIYLSNECVNQCLYCGFRANNKTPRKTLNKKEFKAELDVLIKKGFQNILLVSGENRKAVGMDYLKEIILLAQKKCSYIALEIYSLSKEEYKILRELGVNGVTFYQETYNKDVYDKAHFSGTKKDFYNRLDTPDYIGLAEYRNIGIGALLGLGDWRAEAGYLGLHAQYLMKTYWKSKISISFPRLSDAPKNFDIPHRVSDKHLAQMMLALRIFLHDAGIVISTREPKSLRDNLLGLGVTQISAGSKTMPGGYSSNNGLEQFKVHDNRPVEEFFEVLKQRGFDPVWKDWEEVFNK